MTSRDSFTDDSSNALGLSHSSVSPVEAGHHRALPVPPGGDTVSRVAGPLQEMDLADRKAIAIRVAFDREKRVRELQQLEGWTRRQAQEFVDREAAVPKNERPRLTAEERRLKSIEHDMGMRRPRGGHSSGSKSRRRHTAKAGTWLCPSCNLEYCTHRPKRRTGPKPTVNRSISFGARVSKTTAETIAKWGLGGSDFIEVAAIAADVGVSFSEALLQFRSEHPCRVCPDPLRNVLCEKCSKLRSIRTFTVASSSVAGDA